jgi:DNA-binding response OmpR family regulator
MKQRILIADDDPDVLKLLEGRLIGAGYEVIKASDGVKALGRIKKEVPTLAILDVMMPEMSGLEVCRSLKGDAQTARIPIMLLSARQDEIDRVLGFEFGADDYVVKPFSPREVVLRVQALLRRQAVAVGAVDPIVKVGELTIDRLGLRVLVNGEVVEVTRTEFKLLVTLMESIGRVHSREELLLAVWPSGSEIEVRTVDTHLRRLREKLGVAGQRIETIRGFGYRIDWVAG